MDIDLSIVICTLQLGPHFVKSILQNRDIIALQTLHKCILTSLGEFISVTYMEAGQFKLFVASDLDMEGVSMLCYYHKHYSKLSAIQCSLEECCVKLSSFPNSFIRLLGTNFPQTPPATTNPAQRTFTDSNGDFWYCAKNDSGQVQVTAEIYTQNTNGEWILQGCNEYTLDCN